MLQKLSTATRMFDKIEPNKQVVFYQNINMQNGKNSRANMTEFMKIITRHLLMTQKHVGITEHF